jgi:hypothetical protein
MFAFTAVTRASTMSPTGTPLKRMAKSVAKLTGARARNAFNQVLKNEIMISEKTNPTIKSRPIMIHETKSFIIIIYLWEDL